MLKDAKSLTTLPAADMERAKRWYQDKLGLEPVEEMTGGNRYETAAGTGFTIYPTPNPDRGGHTQLAFGVADLDSEVTGLKGRGVAFEEYDMPGLKTVNGIAEFDGQRGAFFKDSEGNILGIVQMD